MLLARISGLLINYVEKLLDKRINTTIYEIG